MFKRLRERITEEAATRFPVGQDLITLSDSSSVITPLSSPQQFSIAEDEDASPSEQNTPHKNAVSSSVSPEKFFTPDGKVESSSSQPTEANAFLPRYQPSKTVSYVPPSDIESEVEEPPTLNLDGISKDQLLSTIQLLKARLCKYKNKYHEVVKSYKDIHEEKQRIEHTLIDSQDKSFRRIAELREQCQLEQKAKAHLEENLRLILEEKDSRISVLETQISLLKENRSSEVAQVSLNNSLTSCEESKNISDVEEDALSQEKLKSLLLECRNNIKEKIETISQLTVERDNVLQELKSKTKEIQNMQEKEVIVQAEHEKKLKNLQDRLTELEQQQEESAMSMAETKKNMHEELELKEQQLKKTKDEVRQLQLAVEHEKNAVIELKKQYEDQISDLQSRLTNTEKTLEDEKQSLMRDLSRGKAEAVVLMQQECAKKLATAEEEWKMKWKDLQLESEKSWKRKEEDLLHQVKEKENEFLICHQKLKEKESVISKMENQLETLKQDLETLKQTNLEREKEYSIKCADDKLAVAEVNYQMQIQELKDHIAQLEAQKNSIQKDSEIKISSLEDHIENVLKKEIAALSSKLKDSETLESLQLKFAEKNKDYTEKISSLQETVKDKENLILQLKSNIASLQSTNLSNTDELNKKIKQLEKEREQLMLQAQERVAATEAKCREDVQALKNQISELQVQNKEIAKLKNDLSVLNSQLDESLLVAEANQSASAQELSSLKIRLSELQEQISEENKRHSIKEKELQNSIEKLQKEKNALIDKNTSLEKLKEEKEKLNEKVKALEEKVVNNTSLNDKIHLLHAENEQLRAELDSVACLKVEKEQLNSTIRSLEKAKKDLSENIELLKAENDSLRFQSSKQASNDEKNSEFILLREENDSLRTKLTLLEQGDLKDSDGNSVKEYINALKKEYEEKINTKEKEMDLKLKEVIKDFYKQMTVKDEACEQMLSETLEERQMQEEKLEKEHRLEIASLRQDIFEKDCALEEMHEYYEGIIKEKDSKIKEYERSVNLSLPNSFEKGASSTKDPGSETSDWDDTWVVPEEGTEPSPLHNEKPVCDSHIQQIEALQEELAKCNSELKDLRVLMRLSPPQSFTSNNNYSDSTHLPEPTEFEYLRNILFKYMMGKETTTLAKVIAAVLRFNEEQTRLVLQREISKHSSK